METAAPRYSLVKTIKDDKFDVDDLENYKLTLHIGSEDFQITIFDVKQNICLLLEDYDLEKINGPDELIEVLSGIFESHHLLQAGFWSNLKVSFKNSKCTLVPAEFFDADKADEYLSLSCELDPEKDEIYFFKHKTGEYITVFAVDKHILYWLKSIYPALSLRIIHQSCALIEGVLFNKDLTTGDGLSIYLNRQYLHLIVSKGKHLTYYNHFVCRSPEEFLRYILTVMQGLGLSQDETRVLIWGSLDSESTYYKNLYKYIRHVSFARKPSYLKFDFHFDELLDHEYLDLYSIYLCD
ncbi:hypothetical protein BH23BAC1_BH23BAC1_39360 [soil metagenome]